MDTRSVLGGMVLGAALALAVDPSGQARRRRAFVRYLLIELLEGCGAMPGEVDDELLLKRVRAKLARACSHPHAIDIWVRERTATLSGPILTSEVRDLMNAVATVRGVESVRNNLIPQDSADDLPPAPGRGHVIRFPDVELPGRWRLRLPALAGAAALAASGVAIAYARK